MAGSRVGGTGSPLLGSRPLTVPYPPGVGSVGAGAGSPSHAPHTTRPPARVASPDWGKLVGMLIASDTAHWIIILLLVAILALVVLRRI